jgi:tetratricopeptide (TPR) repeat protein
MFATEQISAANYIMVQMPKLKITETWLKENPHAKIPKNLYRQTVSVINLSTDTTLLQTAAGDIISVNCMIEGNYSELESEYNLQGKTYLKNKFRANTATTIFFDSLRLPAFNSFQGTFPDKGRSGQGFPFMGTINAIEIFTGTNWTKKIKQLGFDGKGTAYFTIPFGLSNHTQKSIVDFKPHIYLEDRNGNRYYPVPNRPEQYFDAPELQSWVEVQFNIQIEAPADDFFLRPVVETDEGRILLSNPFGNYDWESKALEKEYSYVTVDEIISKLINCLQYASTKNGYNRLLSRISLIWLKTGRYADALSVIDRLLSSKILDIAEYSAEEIASIKRQHIVALFKTYKFRSALFELSTIEENIIPKDYNDYLIRSCLRQIEIEADIKRAKQKGVEFIVAMGRARDYSRTQFDAVVIATPFVEDAKLLERLASMESIQGQYEEAVLRYFEKQYADAKALLMKLAEASNEQTVSLRDNTFKVVPAALDLIGRIYLNEGDISKAMEYFKRMEAFPNDIFIGPPYGEGSYGGPAGAEGMCQQIKLLMYPNEWSHSEDFKPDYEAAIELAHSLISKYDGVSSLCWEGCSSYNEIGAYYIIECLKIMKAPLSRWETEIRRVIKFTKSDYLSAEILLKLAKKNMESNNMAGANKLYKEVIEKYSYLSPVDGVYDDFRVYSLDAYLGSMDIAMKQKDLKKYEAIKKKAVKIYDETSKKYIMKKDEYLVKELEKQYGRIRR